MLIENYKDFMDYLKQLKEKPTLLLHSCCGPCSTHTLKVLNDYFKITVFYSNSNMDTLEEFEKRLETLKQVLSHFENIELVVDPYNNCDYNSAVLGYEKMGEHSVRCDKCMEMRLERTAFYAKVHNFDFFTTTLSISPYKNSHIINQIGASLEEKYQVKYLFSDFKKENGYQDSIKLSNEWHLYRQQYCGCIYSKKEREEKTHETN